MRLRCLLVFLTMCLAWADEKPRILSTEPPGAVIYLVDSEETSAPANLPVPEGFRLPPGRVVGRSGEPLILDFARDSRLDLYFLHPDCLPKGFALGVSDKVSGSFVLERRTREVTFETRPPGATVYLVVPNRFDPPDPTLPVPSGFSLPRGQVLGASGEPLLIPSGRHTVYLLHPHCQPVDGDVDSLQAKVVTLPYRSGWFWVRGHSLPLTVAALALALSLGLLWKWTQQRIKRAAETEEKARWVREKVPEAGDDPFLGKQFDGYRVLQRLGEGGMAKVYLAVPEETMDEREAVALKILNVDSLTDHELRARLGREIRAYESLRHPNIVRVNASGEFQGHPYLAMELVRGRTLRAYVFRDGMAPKKALDLLTSVFDAVHFANSKGIVHRDLKPENIMITEGGLIKVMDFGLARASNFTQLTATGSILGTPGYMAPEQIQGQLEVATDQYALGVILYEMLAGKLPFYDDNPVTVVMAHLTRPVPPLSEGRPHLQRIQPAVERMLAKDPKDRYRDLKHALTALRHLV